ncbi:hypothetical protein [Halorussus halobius]|uniref:hypothetical protein n=1 Tax=Halorussus halobius TaxID=1710537 RepID=UPI0010926596|nr:hypothetical protein [Halorussus halobius]
MEPSDIDFDQFDSVEDGGERPDGAFSSLLYDYSRRLAACRNHGYAEGHDVPPRAVLVGYDRALHPWSRGWRPGEIRNTLRAKYRSLKQRLADGETDE